MKLYFHTHLQSNSHAHKLTYLKLYSVAEMFKCVVYLCRMATKIINFFAECRLQRKSFQIVLLSCLKYIIVSQRKWIKRNKEKCTPLKD